MEAITYWKDEWRTDEAAANEEAARRVARVLADESETTLFFGDLFALSALPEELADCRHLERFELRGRQAPDGTEDETPFHYAHRSITNLELVFKLPTLTALSISQTWIDDLTGLEGLTALQSLACSFTQVSDLTPLKDLTALQSLVCSGTQVSDLTPLKGLTTLQGLDCSYTKVSDLTGLEGLTVLQSLDCSYTQVSDLTGLEGLTALQSLDCSGTQVNDFSVLLDLPWFLSGDGRLFLRNCQAANGNLMIRGIASLDNSRECAREMIAYLQGSGDPKPDRASLVVSASTVDVFDNGAELDVKDRSGEEGLTERVNPEARDLRRDGLRAQVATLIDECKAAQVPELFRKRLDGYAAAVGAEEPNFFSMDAAIVMIRADIADAYFREPLKPGLIAGLESLVKRNDEVSAYFLPPSDELAAREEAAPDIAPDASATEARDLAEEARAAVDDVDGPAHSERMEQVLTSIRDLLQAAMDRPEEQKRSFMKRAMTALYAMTAKMADVQFLASVTAISTWAASPQGQAFAAQMATIAERVLAFFL